VVLRRRISSLKDVPARAARDFSRFFCSAVMKNCCRTILFMGLASCKPYMCMQRTPQADPSGPYCAFFAAADDHGRRELLTPGQHLSESGA
jgi:hypothetical protein